MAAVPGGRVPECSTRRAASSRNLGGSNANTKTPTPHPRKTFHCYRNAQLHQRPKTLTRNEKYEEIIRTKFETFRGNKNVKDLAPLQDVAPS
eukprot:SAG22_NODE_1246_length_5017_cov_20.060175_4_plen_92_part_00